MFKYLIMHHYNYMIISTDTTQLTGYNNALDSAMETYIPRLAYLITYVILESKQRVLS